MCAATIGKPLKARFQSCDILRMFPTFVWKGELRAEAYQPINDLILRTLREIEPALDDLKPKDSWQSDHALHTLEGFQGLVGCIKEAAATALDYLRIGRQRFEITGCWANVNAPGAGHRLHSHPNNYLSGVYYAQTGEGADTINFHDPRPQTGILCPPVTELTAENADQVVVNVRDGTLLMFPAWLPHSVDSNRSDRLRVSIGFNVMLASYAETISPPWWEPGQRTG
jgi:uncharacterized protein (TIGR02466 family)